MIADKILVLSSQLTDMRAILNEIVVVENNMESFMQKMHQRDLIEKKEKEFRRAVLELKIK
jgi:hypothetical protein